MGCADADLPCMTLPCLTYYRSWFCATSILEKLTSYSAVIEGTQPQSLLRHSSMPADLARVLLQGANGASALTIA